VHRLFEGHMGPKNANNFFFPPTQKNVQHFSKSQENFIRGIIYFFGASGHMGPQNAVASETT
jgi:hypothetical protein